MVYIDHERMGLERAVAQAKEVVTNAKWELFCYDKREILHKNNLTAGWTAGMTQSPENALVSDVGLEKCVFDAGKLRMISAIHGGSGQVDTTVYQCPKCHVNYVSPLNARDKKAHEAHMRTVRY